jgi:hypothetical protein
MQCNAMYVMKSVRPYGMKSVIFFFLFFKKYKKWQNLVEARFRTQDLAKMEIWMDGRTLNEVILPLAKMEISM